MTLKCTGLSVVVGERTLLPATDIELYEGTTLAVVGPSGAGKTSVLTVISGLVPATHGVVTINGDDVRRVNRGQIGVVTEPVLLASTLTVAENIGIPLQATGWEPEDIKERVAELIEELSLAGIADRESTRLSGGQRLRQGRPGSLPTSRPASSTTTAASGSWPSCTRPPALAASWSCRPTTRRSPRHATKSSGWVHSRH
jgi:ABC-type sugar transport system ATPase subunit